VSLNVTAWHSAFVGSHEGCYAWKSILHRTQFRSSEECLSASFPLTLQHGSMLVVFNRSMFILPVTSRPDGGKRSTPRQTKKRTQAWDMFCSDTDRSYNIAFGMNFIACLTPKSFKTSSAPPKIASNLYVR